MSDSRNNGRKDGKRKARNNQKTIIILAGVVAVVAVVLAIVAANFRFLRDTFAGMSYQPSAEMTEIFDALGLTGDGQRIFRASKPELMEKEEFNQKCREAENESAILGCYTDEQIFVYNIQDAELAGIRELTTAHELLHAVYARMSESEKTELVEPLTRVFDSNQEILGSEIENYDIKQKQEELYVRAGTEIKDLPEALEQHYGMIFSDQDKIVGYYNSYISVFEAIEKKMDELLVQINGLNAEIDTKVAEYESRVSSLNQAADEFNECARTTDCFSSSAEFNGRRAELLSEQEALKELYQNINELIDKHNTLVAEYNDNVLHGQTLNKVINSSEKVE